MRNQLLRNTDWASMAHTLEVRTPLVGWTLQRRVAPLLTQHGLAKQDMACTPTEPLPEDLLNWPKSGFTVPVREWLLAGRTEYKSAGDCWDGRNMRMIFSGNHLDSIRDARRQRNDCTDALSVW
jgi:asparagine synthase (glutamine-hydrolysing)